MYGSEFLATYPAKLMEYSLGVGYLALFVPFWKYATGTPRSRRSEVQVTPHDGWFTVPDGVLLHTGHSWARAGRDGLVEVGIDDFAARLLGPVELDPLPGPGTRVAWGEPALVAREGAHHVSIVSPIDGTVVEVNPQAAWQHDPYAGWLLKVRPEHLARDARRLLTGDRARQQVEKDGAALAARLSPKLGAVLHDGGTPVHGIARELEPEHWDDLCREFIH